MLAEEREENAELCNRLRSITCRGYRAEMSAFEVMQKLTDAEVEEMMSDVLESLVNSEELKE